MQVFAIRHGETVWSLTGQHTGTTDIPLTENGRRLAEWMRSMLIANAFELVLCSPMQRARETCALAGLSDKAVVDSDLVEWNYGEYEGLTPEQIHKDAPGWMIFRNGCPGGETPEQVAARMDRVIARSRAVDGDVALFAHGHVLRVLAARWIGLPPSGGEHFLLDTSTLSVLSYYRGVPAVRTWNGSFTDLGAHTAAGGSGTKVDSSLAPKTRVPKRLLSDREITRSRSRDASDKTQLSIEFRMSLARGERSMKRPTSASVITRDLYDAVLFDLDGVITDTANLHAACWKQMFDEYLQNRAKQRGEEFKPFDLATDYLLYVDGKQRFDGVRDFLKSRGIRLPEGSIDDPPSADTVGGLGNRKNNLVNAVIEEKGVDAYEGSVKLIRQVRQEGFKTAIVTSSQNCTAVLRAAKLDGFFDAQVDGKQIHAQHLAGKPAPDTFLRAAQLLGTEASRTVVIEDAISGVQAGCAGNFGLVIGVARKGNEEELKQNGAHVVVNDLAELVDIPARGAVQGETVQ